MKDLVHNVITHLENGPGEIALTYDDGPNEPYTPQLLDIFARHGAKGTFFVVGKYVRHHPEIVRRIAEEGHAIGNHSYTHRNLSMLSAADVRLELEGCSQAIADATGSACHLFRPPFGLLSETSLRVACDLDLQTFCWSVATGDFEMPAPEIIVERASRQIELNEKGEIVLLHDGGHAAFGMNRSATVAATEQLIQKYHDKSFVALQLIQKSFAARA